MVGRKSPLTIKNKKEEGKSTYDDAQKLNAPVKDASFKSPSNESIKNIFGDKQGNGTIKTPVAAQKPRPWSVLGHESKHDFSGDSTKTTPDAIDNGELL